jgi:hypothetical protein
MNEVQTWKHNDTSCKVMWAMRPCCLVGMYRRFGEHTAIIFRAEEHRTTLLRRGNPKPHKSAKQLSHDV